MNTNKRFFIEIDGELVPMELNPYTINMYKRHFKRNLVNDTMRFAVLPVEERETKKGMIMAKIIWVLAKSANPRIQPFYKWFDNLNRLPVYELFPQVVDELIGEVK